MSPTRGVWPFRLLLALTAIGVVAMGVMLATGYVPTEGFSNNGQHELRFGLVAGYTGGLLIAAIFEGMARA